MSIITIKIWVNSIDILQLCLYQDYVWIEYVMKAEFSYYFIGHSHGGSGGHSHAGSEGHGHSHAGEAEKAEHADSEESTEITTKNGTVTLDIDNPKVGRCQEVDN